MGSDINPSPLSLRTALGHGVVGGLIAGVVFAVAEVVAAALMGPSPFAPLQLIGAIALGPGVLPPAPLTVTTAAVALALHLALSAVYGIILAVVVWAVAVLRAAVPVTAALGAAYGLLLWIVNFYLIGALLYPWFTQTNPVVQFIMHTVFFGGTLGWYLGAQLARRPAYV